ncbi:MAG: cyclase family protein [Thermoplasmata archaeon]
MSATPRVHDLTALLTTHMPTWPTSPLPVFEPVGLVPRDGYAIERVNCLTHTGTHMDAPFHFLEEGLTVDRIPPEKLIGRAAVLDLRTDLSGTLIPTETVRKHWPTSFRPEIVLIETGWSHERASTQHYLYDFPGLTPEAAGWVADQGIWGIGTDTLGIDPFLNTKFEAHKVLLGRNIWILEALDHLDELSEDRPYTLIAGPLKIAGASGAMARVFALEP